MCKIIIALVLFASAALVTADIPVHCEHKHVLGEWTFHRTAADKHSHELSPCSKAGSYLGGGDFELGEPSYTAKDSVKVTLGSPNLASATIDGKKVQGTWTMMYDEGFEVVLGTQKYFAFSKYTGQEKHTTSHCDKTFPGWFHANPEEASWGCYHGVKDTPVAPQTFRRFGEGKAAGFKRDAGGDIVAPSSSTDGEAERHAMPTDYDSDSDSDDELDSEDYMQFVSMVQVGATAEGGMERNFYSGQEHVVKAVNEGHNKGHHTWHASEYAHRPMRAMGNWKHDYKGVGESNMMQIKSWREAAAKKVDDTDIPAHFDWRSVNGKNYVPPVKDQKCGSCYAFSTRDMMEARLHILLKKEVPKRLSVQSVLSCNQYSQGCAGGFPYTVAKFYQDYGAPTDVDQPSDADSVSRHMDVKNAAHPDKVQCAAKAKPEARAWDYKYVGGFYGATNEKAMRRDIYDHGPLAVCFQVAEGFGNYRGGIFRQEAALPRQDHYGRVNHAVLVVGFGEDNGHKYWLVKNSWGEHWGDNGYFKIERGTNQLNMEGDAVAAYPSAGPTMDTPQKMLLTASSGKMLLEEEAAARVEEADEVVLADVGDEPKWIDEQDQD